MRQLLMKAGVPFVAVAVALTGFAGAASANAKSNARPVYTIAYQGPLSGGNAQLGLNMDYAVRVAIADANAGTTFGKLPFVLHYVRKDDQGDPTKSPTAAAQLTSNKSVIAVVGPAFSGATKAAEPTFHAAHLATVSPSASNTLLATYHWNNFFRVVAADNIQGPQDADYAVMKQHFKKIYNISDASTYGAGLAAAFGARAKHDGASVTNSTVPNTTGCGNGGSGNPTQYSGVASTIVSSNPTLVFYGGYYCDLGLLLTALHNAGYHGKVMSGDGSDDPKLIVGTTPASAANGVLLTCACSQLGSTPADKKFAAEFHKAAHFAPGTYSAEAYDATNAEIQVMVTLWKAHAAKSETRANVVAGLHTVSYKGLTKTIKFFANGNIAGTAVYVNRVQGGKIVQLGLE